MKNLFPILLFLLSFFSYSQNKRASNWVFAEKNKIKFSENGLTHSNTVAYIDFLENYILNSESYSAISDEQGHLQAFSNEVFIVRADETQINFGRSGIGQGGEVIFIPKPQISNQYYVFFTNVFSTCNSLSSSNNFSLLYELVDTEAINEFGEKGKLLEEKIIRRQDPVSVKLAATAHHNQKDYWVLVHEWNNNTFVAYLLTERGITDSVKTSIGSTYFKSITCTDVWSSPNNNNFGQMKISPAGDLLAVTMFVEKSVEVFSFDNSTGKLDCFTSYDLSEAMGTDEFLYGVEISPNGRFVYVSSQSKIIFPEATGLYQIDLLEPDKKKAIRVISKANTGYTGLQLAIDGKIYVAKLNQGYLGVIHQPNLPFPQCSFEENGVFLNGNKSGISLCNTVSSFLPSNAPVLEMPNAFTPNGDGVNDSFVPIRMEGIWVESVHIYNSWGREVYQGANFEQPWDAKNVPSGVYHYVINYYSGYRCSKNLRKLKGWVKVLR